MLAGGEGLDQAKKHNRKIMITDVAIEKVPYVQVPGFSEQLCKAIQEKHKSLLRIAQQENDSNEVLAVWRADVDRAVYVLGTEHHVNAASSPEAYGLFATSDAFSLMYLHNHPSTSKFSLYDIADFIRYRQLGLISVVTNQGNVYILKKMPDWGYTFKQAWKLFHGAYAHFAADEWTHEKTVDWILKNSKEGGIAYVKGV